MPFPIIQDAFGLTHPPLHLPLLRNHHVIRTILPGLSLQPTRDELVGLFYTMLFTDLAPILSMMPAPINMLVDDAEYPLTARDLTGNIESHPVITQSF